MTKRRPTSRTPLLTSALAKPHRLGDALSQALGRQNSLAAPAMGAITSSRRLSHGQAWSTPSQWQHGRVLHAPAPVATPSWQYPDLSRMGAQMAHQGGIALLELMLVIGVVAIGTAGVVATYRVVDNNRKINEEVEHATTIAQNIVANSVTRGDFSIVNQENAIRDGIFPQDMLDASGDPHSVWGGDVLVTATDIEGKPNWGSVLTFEGVPAGACAKLVAQAAPGFYAVSVNDQNVRTNYGPLDMAAVASLCADGGRVQFTYAKHGGAGESFDAVNPCTVPAPEIDTIIDAACPTGQLGTITYRTDYACQSPYGPATDLPAVETSNTCTPACVLPSPAVNTDSETRTGTQVLACPSGQSSTAGGTAGITQTRTEGRYRTSTAFCPPAPPGYTNPVGPYSWTPYGTFTPWAATTPWTTTSDTCAPNCVLPSPSTQTDTETQTATQTLSCPPGQLGSISQSQPQSRTRNRTASCPAPTGSFSWSPWGAWSPWAATAPWTTTSNTCATACTLPSPSTQTNSQTQTATQTIACPPGQVTPAGATNGISQSRTEQRDQTRTASCPAPTGPYTWSAYTPYGPWYPTTPWTTTANACAPACTLPSPSTETNTETRTGSQTFTCPTGQLITTTGPAQYQASGTQTRSEQRSQTRVASCPSYTGAYTWGAWSAFGSWAGTSPWSPVYTCSPQCSVPAPTPAPTQTQPATCPTGQVTTSGASTFTQTRTGTVNYACPTPISPAAVGTTTWSPWTPDTATACAPQCVAPPASTESRAGTPGTQTLSCPAGQTGAITQTRTVTEYRSVSYSCPTATGPTSASYGAWGTPAPTYGTWTTTSNTCAPTCVAPPNTTETQTQPASCLSGRVTPAGASTFTQSHSRSVTYSCPAPTGAYTTAYGSWSAWSPTESAACAPACTVPATTNTPESQTFTCPAGQLITTAGPSQYQSSGTQGRTKTTTYSCPAPTGSATANTPTYTPWTPAFTCAPTCSAPATTNTPESQSAACPAGEVTSAGATSFTQTRTRTNTYSCPAPTGSYTANAATYTSWTPTAATACNPQCTKPASQQQWLTTSDTACPAGTSGTRTYEYQQQRDGANCATPWSTPSYGGWYNTGATRNINTSGCAPVGNPCVVPSTPAITRSWTDPSTGEACGPKALTAGTYAHGSYLTTYYTKTNKYASWDGTATWQCVNGTVSSTATYRDCYYSPEGTPL